MGVLFGMLRGSCEGSVRFLSQWWTFGRHGGFRETWLCLSPPVFAKKAQNYNSGAELASTCEVLGSIPSIKNYIIVIINT